MRAAPTYREWALGTLLELAAINSRTCEREGMVPNLQSCRYERFNDVVKFTRPLHKQMLIAGAN